MRDLESIFVREYKEAVKASIGSKGIYDVPLPPVVKQWEVSGTDMYNVRDIKESEFSALENKYVRKVPSKYAIQRRVVDKVTRNPKTDEEGNLLYKEVKVPVSSIAVFSHQNLKLKYSWFASDSCKNGYGYVDYIVQDGKQHDKLYIYILPKSVLYKVNQTALVMTTKGSMKNYTGVGYQTWSMGIIHFFVIPYKPNVSYENTRVLATRGDCLYKKYLDCIIKYWLSVNFIPELNLSELGDGSNLTQKLVPDSGENYIPCESIPLNGKEIYGSEGGTGVEN